SASLQPWVLAQTSVLLLPSAWALPSASLQPWVLAQTSVLLLPSAWALPLALLLPSAWTRSSVQPSAWIQFLAQPFALPLSSALPWFQPSLSSWQPGRRAFPRSEAFRLQPSPGARHSTWHTNSCRPGPPRCVASGTGSEPHAYRARQPAPRR